MSTLPNHKGQLALLFRHGKRFDYAKGEFVVRPGEEPTGVFFIESGLIKSFNYTRYGEENLLSLRKDGEVIGLTLAVTGKKLNVMYTALAPSVLWRLPASQFLDYLRASPESSLATINLLTEMYRLHSEHILNLEYRSVRERLVAYLLTTRWRFGKKINGYVVIEAPLRHQDIASYINASRETTSRELNRLQAKGLIESSQGLIILKDIEKLRSYLEI